MITNCIFRIMTDTHSLLYFDPNLKGLAVHHKMAGGSYKHVSLQIFSRDQEGKSFIKVPCTSILYSFLLS